MRVKTLFAVMATALPLLCGAQDDDMYFVPKKKSVPQKTVEKVAPLPSSPVRQEEESESACRDVDEYNRRYTFAPATRVVNDTLYFDDEKPYDDEEDAYYDDEGEWVNGFGGTDEDYACARRLLRFRAPTVGIAVSSPLYWDLCYGPASLYWNVYDDGAYAYVFPSVWHPAYYGGWTTSWYWGCGGWGWSWGFHRPWYDPWYGWCSPWYDPWYGGWHPYPHHGVHHVGWSSLSRPHSSRREGVWYSSRSGRATSTYSRTGVRGSNAVRGGSSARTSTRGSSVTPSSSGASRTGRATSRTGASTYPSRGTTSASQRSTSRSRSAATTPTGRTSRTTRSGAASTSSRSSASSRSSRSGTKTAPPSSPSTSTSSWNSGSSRGSYSSPGGALGGSSRGGGSSHSGGGRGGRR